MTKLQWIQLVFGHWDLVAALEQAAEQLVDPALGASVSKRWEILKKAGDLVVPTIDQLVAQLLAKPATPGVTASGLMQTEAELETAFIESMQQHYLDKSGADRTAAEIIAASVTTELPGIVPTAPAPARRFDGHRLAAAYQLFQQLIPLLTAIAPTLIPLLTGVK